MSENPVHIVGGGLAGSEAAWQLAERGVRVVLHEMRPVRGTPAHQTDGLAELVCSNTFKSTELTNAHGLLKAEMRALGCMILECADEARVAAGTALAVDRELFSELVSRRVHDHPLITVERGEVTELPEVGIVASGPLTSDALTAAIQRRLGLESLAFYDAIAPIVDGESIDESIAFRQSRWDRETMGVAPALAGAGGAAAPLESGAGGAVAPPGSGAGDAGAPLQSGAGGAGATAEKGAGPAEGGKLPPDGEGGDAAPEGAYLNCPMSREEYERFLDALIAADQYEGKEFDPIPYFEGCMPVEEMAKRGRETLRFGPLKPIGLRDPRSGGRPWAVVQLRREDRDGRMWNMVGFQTRMRTREQARVLRMIPGLENAEFLRWGSIHRNSYINAPAALSPALALRDRPTTLFAGQLTGVEGYTESTATGLLAGINLSRVIAGDEPVIPPPTTMLGAVYRYLREADPKHFQPMNANFGLMEPLAERVRDKRRKRELLADRAMAEIARWRDGSGIRAAAAAAVRGAAAGA